MDVRSFQDQSGLIAAGQVSLYLSQTDEVNYEDYMEWQYDQGHEYAVSPITMTNMVERIKSENINREEAEETFNEFISED